MHERDSHHFERHWREHRLPAIPAGKLEAARAFLTPLLDKNGIAAAGRICLDVGCGDGVHLSLLEERAPELVAIGVDISTAALRSAIRRAPRSLAICGDAQNLPLPDAACDVAFSYGVLAYLPDPWRGLAEVVRVTKPGGHIGVWFYPKSTGLFGQLFGLVRAIVPSLPGWVQKRIADAIVPFLGLLPTAGGLSLRNASWQACREVVLVNIAPPHLILPAPDEVIERLQALGCRIVEVDEQRPITIWAQRVT